MVGGIITQVIATPGKIWIDCEEQCSTSKCAIYVERNETSEKIRPGDKIWWQGGYAMWTPYGTKGTGLKSGKDYDIKIPRIGFSGVKKP